MKRVKIGCVILSALALLLSGSALNAATPAKGKATSAGELKPSPMASANGVAWLQAAGDKEVEAAFALAKSANKPVLLYWGAVWCPPCNQLKATLFNRQDFIAMSRALIPLHIDGDLPGAQKLGARFKVVGYPTLILFSPGGSEITRLPGEADALRVIDTIQRGLQGGRSIAAILAEATAGKVLPLADWQALAFYSWATDEGQLVAFAERDALLSDLAERAKAVSPEVATRLWLNVLAAREIETGAAGSDEQRARLLDILHSAETSFLNADVLLNGARPIVRALSEVSSAERTSLLTAFDAALMKLQSDPRLSRADRTGAILARVELARIEVPEKSLKVELPAALLADVAEFAKTMDREITNGYERQAVITSVGQLLRISGLVDESNALLEANLKKSPAPYYLMSQLGGNAKLQGRKADALAWYERAYRESKGPATRLQWGAGYIGALFDLSPDDAPRIEKAVLAVFADAAKDSGAFFDRSARSLKRITGRVDNWSKPGTHAAELTRLRAAYDNVCRKLPAADPQRQTCETQWPRTAD